MYENRKKYSQNFLKSPLLVKQLFCLGDIQIERKSLVLEIGPGKGIITREIVKYLSEEGSLICIEIDSELVKYLKQEFRYSNKVNIINDDFLNHNLPNRSFSVVSNLPFSCTSSILDKLLDPRLKMEDAILVIQKEAAFMFMGELRNTLKSLRAFPFWDFEIRYLFKKEDFKPSPTVDVVLLKISRKQKPLIPKSDYLDYLSFTKNVAQDRAGEGIWKRLFTKKQLSVLVDNFGLVINKGIGSQSPIAIVQAFRFYKKEVTIP